MDCPINQNLLTLFLLFQILIVRLLYRNLEQNQFVQLPVWLLWLLCANLIVVHISTLLEIYVCEFYVCIWDYVFVTDLFSYRYCPGGPDSDFEYSTQSYTGYEPTSMRAIRARYDPYLQSKQRIDQVCRFNTQTISEIKIV